VFIPPIWWYKNNEYTQMFIRNRFALEYERLAASYCSACRFTTAQNIRLYVMAICNALLLLATTYSRRPLSARTGQDYFLKKARIRAG